jgi:2-keto-4-pentenoate hydratase
MAPTSVTAVAEAAARLAEAACTGRAAAPDPLTALGWLARTAREFGDPLCAGQIILSGALGPMVPAPSGSRFRAEIDPLGEVTATFCEEETS